MNDNTKDPQARHAAVPRPMPNRRQLIRSTATAAATLPLIDWLAAPAAWADDAPQPLNRYPRMVQEYFVDQVRRAERRNLAAKARLETEADARRYVETVREKIRRCFGPQPERTPLNPRITSVVERDQYRIENVIFDSRPGFPVTANLYIPKNAPLPAPGVIGSCGHSSNGKAAAPYQSFAQGLARLGYVCLLFDPVGQGERLQYVKDDLSPRHGAGVAEHLLAGNQQFLVGEFLGAWRAWDGIRALDYLLTRDEVDKNHLGITGNSGGGTMTTWLCGLEPRWTMAAPSCFVTTFLHNMENELPADTEQCPPQALALGLDMDDFLAAMAPKPVIVLAKERDFFDVRGAEEAYGRLQRLYELLGEKQHVALFTGPTTHGYSQENREAMYGWFNGATQRSQTSAEPPITIEKDATLHCTAEGQVAPTGARTIFSFTCERSEQLSQARGKVDGPALAQALRRVLRMPPTPDQAPDFRILRYLQGRAYPRPHAIAYAVQTEPGIAALVYMLGDERWSSRPPRDGKQATLYVAHHSSDQELRDEPLIGEIIDADPQMPVFSCDVRGIGESRPDTCGIDSFLKPYGCDYFYAIHGLMLDRPYVGQKTFDVLRVLDWLADYGYTDVHLVAKGWGALPATFAAVLSDRVTRVTLKNALTSYAAIAQSEQYHWPLSAFLPNVLAHFDMPDCYRALQSKQLRQLEPWDALAGEESS